MTKTYKRKLIEVAIPLEAINAASAKEKMPGIGAHPRGIHLWWARRPLAACRAVLFAQLVDDPSSHPDKFPTEEDVDEERKRLFKIVEDLVVWQNSTNESVLKRAREEIRRSCDNELPPIYDPFSGGGSIPLEAQRLGLPAYGSDINPVAVMIGKSMIEIPPKFKDWDPVHPGPKDSNHYRYAEGLAEDVKYYGEWMREKAFQRIGHLYPQADVSKEVGSGKATVIAWIWARTVPSPDPAFGNAHVPIASSFLLSSKAGKEVWVKPIVDKAKKTISYRIRKGGTTDELSVAKSGTKVGRGANFRCLLSETAITPAHVKTSGMNGNLGQCLIAIVTQGRRGRDYVEPLAEHVNIAFSARPDRKPQMALPGDMRAFWTPPYGLRTFGDLFTDRQLVALNTFSDLVHEARIKIERDAKNSGLSEDSTPFREDGIGANAYAEAVSVYLAFGVERCADFNNSIVRWNSSNEKVMNLFARQAIPMTWDFGEANILAEVVGGFTSATKFISQCISKLVAHRVGSILAHDAQMMDYKNGAVISTDPPYYDNIGYADLSDFFYCWMKPLIRPTFPELFGVLATPKSEEIVATPYRHGSKKAAEDFFLEGMSRTIANMARQSSPDYPTTLYYAFKQSEIIQEGISSTGWATFLQAVLEAGYAVVSTWPVRSEQAHRIIASGTNALANSVVLVCRKREDSAETISRAEFIGALKRQLPMAIENLQKVNISPADMPQSAIGPGMGIFSRCKAVLEADDSPMTVKTALQLINGELDEYLGGIQGEFDADTRFAITWFEQNGLAAGEYGEANNIAMARGISVSSVQHAGIVESAAGKVRILNRDEIDSDWNPTTDTHLTVWECCQHLIRTLEQGGEQAAALLLKKIGPVHADAARDLAYCMYDICANKRRDAGEATAYNGLIAVWPELTRQAAEIYDIPSDGQVSLEL